MHNIITIDGPAGVGKGTVCKLLGKYLGTKVLNSGEIYRAIAYSIKKNNVDYKNTTDVISYMKYFKFREVQSSKLYSKNIDLISSKISSIPSLRKSAIKIQRDFVKLNNFGSQAIIAEGRDMGTVIFPKAKIKIFLWANAQIRAKRRTMQINKSGKIAKFSKIYEEITLRDQMDMNRKTAPLRPAEDSYLIDNSNLDIEQSFNKILKIINKFKL